METVFFQSIRININEKTQLFEIDMKKLQNDTMTYTVVTIFTFCQFVCAINVF